MGTAQRRGEGPRSLGSGAQQTTKRALLKRAPAWARTFTQLSDVSEDHALATVTQSVERGPPQTTTHTTTRRSVVKTILATAVATVSNTITITTITPTTSGQLNIPSELEQHKLISDWLRVTETNFF